MTTWINNKLVEIPYNKIDYWTMYVDGDLSLEELLKLLEINKVFENYNKNKMKDLHEQAIELMEKLIVKYKLKDVLLSLDEFVVEYSYILHPDEIKEINNLINKF